jgi:tRNA threonylcarbamoyl adenosine modification protein YjeE
VIKVRTAREARNTKDRAPKFEITRTVKSLADMRRLAADFACELKARGSATVLFAADMGAGKTTFTAAVLRSLAPNARVSSPTFSIIADYAPNIFHVDLYRIENTAELLNTDFADITAGGNYVFIEWAERLTSGPSFTFAAPVYRVEIKLSPNARERTFIIKEQ